MRKLLATAVAIAPLMAAFGAQAQVVISNTRTTPIQTSNASGSAADSIRIAEGGGVTVNSGVAVTLNSSNTVDIDSGGRIAMDNAADGATALLVQGGNTASVIIGGTISVSDNIETPSDTDNDGDLDGPTANGTNRYGVRVVGPGAFTGDVLLEDNGLVIVEGNQSAAIALETGLTGNVRLAGATRIVGDQSTGVRIAGPVSGEVRLGGLITAAGESTEAVDITGDISGRLTVQNEMTATGYRYNTRPPAAVIAKLDPDDLLQGGSVLAIGANVGGGVVFDAQPTLSETNTDVDGDGIADGNESTANLTSYGSAAAVAVGSTSRTVTLGLAGTGDNAFGFINRGEIAGEGVYDNVAATGISIGVAGGQAVTVAGGVRNEGAVAASAAQADATALHFRAGASTPTLVNTGVISAASSTALASNVSSVRIDAGANVSSLTNTGVLLAGSEGGTAAITTVRDESGTLSTIANSGQILANRNVVAGGATTGSSVALDLRANTTGVSLTQTGVTSTPAADNPDTDGDGVPDRNEPAIAGDILLGSGADVLDIRNGTVRGALAFGAGQDRLDISGGAEVRGAVTDSDGRLDINVANGVLDARQTGITNISSLNVAGGGDLIVNLDPANSTAAGFRVAGTANLADGAGLGVRFNSLLTTPQRFSIIEAGTLNFGRIDQAVTQANSPFLFVVNAEAVGNSVFVDARRRTADEAGLIAAEAGIFDAFYASLNDNAQLRELFLDQTGRREFLDLFEQTLPDHSGGPLLSLASGVDAVTRALTGRNASAAPGQTSAWVQEINFYADKDRTDTYGFRSEGFGVAGGVERGTGVGAFGLSLAFTSSDLEDPEAQAEEVLSASLVEMGLYWRAQGQYWTTWARVAGGYATFDATRQLVTEGVNLRNESQWNGFTLAAAGGVSYERHFGKINIRPELYAEYFSLREDGRIEEGGGAGFDLDLDERNGHLFSAVAAMNIGYGFGRDGWVRPELRVGWRHNISIEGGDTIGRFSSGGPDFVIPGGEISGGGPILGFRLNVGNELGMVSLTGDAELLEDYIRYTLLLRASFRF